MASTLAMVLLWAVPASAAVYDVNSAADPAVPGCTGGTCTLRQAVDKVNGGSGSGDTINLPAGHYTLLIGGLTVTKPVAIVGQGGTRSTVIDGNASFGIIEFATAAAPSSISGVTLTNGKAAYPAIGNATTLALTDVAVIGNENTTFDGGGIYNDAGTLTIDRSTIAGNKTAKVGGGIYNQGTLTVTNSTISGNIANTSNGLLARDGGGIYSSGTGTIINTTIAGNTAYSGGGLYRGGGTVTLGNSIVAANIGTSPNPANCLDGPYVSLGGNLEDADSCTFDQSTDLRHTPAGLGGLQDNGGPTDTRALQPGSAAIDHGVNCPPPATDQRGIVRPQGPGCDSGAFELQVPPAPDIAAPVVSAFAFGRGSFAAATSGGSIARKRKRVPVGTTISFRLSEAANATFTVERVIKGHKKGRKCSAKRRKGKRCTIYKSAGSFSRASSAGRNSFKFTGRVRNKALKRGSYRMSMLAADVAGNKSKVQRKNFKIKQR